jgi:hypothetical protein
MKRKLYLLAALAAFSFLFLQVGLAAAAAPLKVVVVSGSNYEMGVQYGEQAADLIAANRDVTWNLLDTGVTAYPGGPALGHEVILKDIQVWTYYLEKYNPKLKEWLNGIVKGCKNKRFDVSYVDLVALMVLPQEMWARPSWPYPAETQVVAYVSGKSPVVSARGRTDTKAMASCTSFAATGTATLGGVPMVSLTLGFISEITQYVVLVAFPDEGERFINLTMAGKVTNNTGMNDKYAWTMTAAVTDPTKECSSNWGVPSEAYHHYMQQYTKSPGEAMDFIGKTPRGGVTGVFLFAEKSGEVSAYECSHCTCVMRKPHDLGENKDFVASTNNYNSPIMVPYAIPKDWFGDTYIRYDTIFNELSSALPGTIGLGFTKAAWLSNRWYDAATNTWNTVPVPNDTSDPNICNVPGNNCEGGESQVIQFPAQNTAYLQSGGPHGTSITYYWPDDPKPTGEYTKWQLTHSMDATADAASGYALRKIESAWASFWRHSWSLAPQTRNSLKRLLDQASHAWQKGKMEEASAGYGAHGWGRTDKRTRMAQWGAAYTNYATAQLYSQMVLSQLKAE